MPRGVTVTFTRTQVKALIRAVGVVEMAVDGGRLNYTTRAWFDLHDAEARLKHALATEVGR